jgi:hypothetical protein
VKRSQGRPRAGYRAAKRVEFRGADLVRRDTIVGFQHEHEAKAFLDDLRDRMRAFELALHPDKTRLSLHALGRNDGRL